MTHKAWPWEEPLLWSVTLAGCAVVVFLLVWRLKRRMKRLVAGLRAAGFIVSEEPRMVWSTEGGYEPTVRGTWRGLQAEIRYGGDRRMTFTHISLGARSTRSSGHVRDAPTLVRELDALLAQRETP